MAIIRGVGATQLEDSSIVAKYLRRAGHALRLRGPLAHDPNAQVLHALLVGLTCWNILFAVVFLPFDAWITASVVEALLHVLAIGSALFLLHRGSLREASLIYLCGSWLLHTSVIVLNGGIHSVGLVYYVALPITAAWLFGFQASLWAAAVCMGCALILAVLEYRGVSMPRYHQGVPFGIWIGLMAAVVMATVPVARVLQIFKEALAQSRSDQESLRKYQEHLEELVGQRTAELTVARDQAQAANRAKSVFLANMSHELRTPLNAILGFSNLLHDDPGISPKQRRDVEIVNRSGEHLLNLIDNVLDMAKIEVGHIAVEKATVDLSRLLRDSIDIMRVRAEEKDLELLLDPSPELPRFVQADASKLRQVLINLIGNAVKYTERGGVTLRVVARPADVPEYIRLIFQVEDTGIGIAAADHARVFEPFVQLGKAATHKGTGLGLAITRQFVELMGGVITLESAPHEGSLFRVEVPVEQVEESEVTLAQDQSERIIGLAPDQPAYRILIVEDEVENRLLLRRLLEDVGFRVQSAENGLAGVEIFRTWRPHFIWMDRRMPVMDGIEATRRIRALGGRDVKIVAVTASVFSDQRDELLAAGLDDFMRKPYRSAEIFDCMARHLGVQYVYRAVVMASGGNRNGPLGQDSLATLPKELRAELHDALVRLDTARVSGLVDCVSEMHPAIGAMLAHHAEKFAYSAILHALEKNNSDSMQART